MPFYLRANMASVALCFAWKSYGNADKIGVAIDLIFALVWIVLAYRARKLVEVDREQVKATNEE